MLCVFLTSCGCVVQIDELDQVWFAADPTAFDHADNATSVTSYGGDALIRAVC